MSLRDNTIHTPVRGHPPGMPGVLQRAQGLQQPLTQLTNTLLTHDHPQTY